MPAATIPKVCAVNFVWPILCIPERYKDWEEGISPTLRSQSMTEADFTPFRMSVSTHYTLLCAVAAFYIGTETTVAQDCRARTNLTWKNVTVNTNTSGKYLYWGCRIHIPDTSQ